MARKGLPKKYAKMGFKRGWAAYKRARRSPTRKVARRNPIKRRVYRTARRKKYIRYARGGGGKFKPIIDGFIAGAGGEIASRFLGGYGHPVATLGVGYFRNNATLKTEGARELGAMLVSTLGGGGLTGGLYE